MSAPIAIWDWEREPQPPSARAVVCRPGLYSTPVGIEAADPRTQMNVFVAHGGAVVLPFEAHLMPSFKMRRGIIPALYAERQAELSGVGALLTVNAERRALVLCPREELQVYSMLRQASECAGLAPIDLVAIIPPPSARACPGCAALPVNSVGDCSRCGHHGPGPGHICRGCPTCNGSGRIDPWPVHPAWIRGIVEQCRAAGVLVVADFTSDAPSALPEWLT